MFGININLWNRNKHSLENKRLEIEKSKSNLYNSSFIYSIKSVIVQLKNSQRILRCMLDIYLYLLLVYLLIVSNLIPVC
jgi:hypothetical protein